jgi:hypothetical protein
MSADQIAAAIRAALAGGSAGGLVGIDEITANDWDEARAAGLESALAQLGADAERLVVYVGPALVTQVGGVDLRTPLDARTEHLMAAFRLAGATFLETYHGKSGPFSAQEFAVPPTRWLARWTPGDPGRLHILFGFDQSGGWKGLFALARATEAGRTILANGAGVYGLQSAAQGLDWLGAYREFLANPTAPPPQGDYKVPVGGGLTVRPPKARAVFISIDRPARAVIRLVLHGQTKGRVIGVLHGPTAGVSVAIPRNVKAGRYDIVVVMEGEGLSDNLSIPAVVGPPTAPLRLRFARGVLRVSLAGGNQMVIRVIPVRPTLGPARAIAKLSGPLRNRTVKLPAILVAGRYRGVAVSGGLDGRQTAGIGFRLARR